MGLTQARVRVHGPKGGRTLRLLVDTGSVYTWISREVLKRIGVAAVAEEPFRTIDRRLITRAVADVRLEYDGSPRYCPVAFAQKGDAKVLGVTAMEILGLEVDPSTRQLRRVKAHAAYASDQ